MHDPRSTITNLSFVVVGALLLPIDIYSGIMTILLGIASGLYHATKKRRWQHADVIMIYFVFLAIISYLAPIHWMVSLTVAAILGVMHEDIPSHLVIGILGAIVLIIMMIIGEPVMWTIIWFGLWGISNIPWFYGDFPDWVRDSTHSLSHIFASIGIYSIFL